MIGPDAFSEISEVAKYVHNFTSFAFMAGLVLIIVIFFKDNLPEKVDLDWLRQGGGFIKNKHAPAGRFNLGEKLVYWLSLVAGIAVSLSGFLLLFPFYGTDIADMQIAQGAHAVVAVLFVALILAHIYIGTLGMEGAFEAMGTGDVDLNWAKEHHDLWLARQLERSAGRDGPRRRQPNERWPDDPLIRRTPDNLTHHRKLLSSRIRGNPRHAGFFSRRERHGRYHATNHIGGNRRRRLSCGGESRRGDQ